MSDETELPIVIDAPNGVIIKLGDSKKYLSRYAADEFIRKVTTSLNTVRVWKE